MSLNDLMCKNAKPKAKEYKLADSEGLYLLVKPNGTKCWRYKYRFAGKERKLAIGLYPSVSLSAARDKRSEARKMLDEDIDPSQAKKHEKRLVSINAQNSFEAIAREWHENNKHRWTEKHALDILHRLERDIFPEIGQRPITEISALELLDVFKKMEKRGIYETAHRTLQYCTRIFRYAVLTARADRNPSLDLKDALKPATHGHYKALDAKDLPGFMRCLEHNNARLYPLTRLAVKMLLLTFVRTSELLKARWEEIDETSATWIIPSERMKKRRDHIVPLSKQVLEILKELKGSQSASDYLFPNQAKATGTMSENTILGAIERMGYKEKTTGHGFRALAMTTLKEKLNYRHEVIDRQLAHAPENKIIAAYDRAEFLDERRKMMQEWADFVESQGGNHVQT